MAWTAKVISISAQPDRVDVVVEIFNGAVSKGQQNVALPFEFTVPQAIAIIRERIVKAHKADDLNASLQQYVNATVTET